MSRMTPPVVNLRRAGARVLALLLISSDLAVVSSCSSTSPIFSDPTSPTGRFPFYGCTLDQLRRYERVLVLSPDPEHADNDLVRFVDSSIRDRIVSIARARIHFVDCRRGTPDPAFAPALVPASDASASASAPAPVPISSPSPGKPPAPALK